MNVSSLEEFYKQFASVTEGGMDYLLPNGLDNSNGHFNVLNVEDLLSRYTGGEIVMPYNRKTYYKISLVSGRNIAEYADKVINIETNALVYGTPKIPYNWLPQDFEQAGYFCVFTSEFIQGGKLTMSLDDLPIFSPGGYPIFEISDKEAIEVRTIFKKMQQELSSDYAYKNDLLRNYLLELIHYGQKLQPMQSVNVATHNAAARVSNLFMELLERQFPIVAQGQKVNLRSAKDYAGQLSIHINHLNKMLKENTGKTTTEHINARLVQEAKVLLKHSDWNISEIAYSLGFEQLSHFSNFFKKQTSYSPIEIRNPVN